MAWILLTLFYGVIKGAREIVKKKALEISTVMEVLFFYTLFGFLMILPDIPHVWGMTPRMYLLVALKSFVIFVAWLCGFYAIKRLPVSVYGILDLSRVLFSTLLGVFVIGEEPGMLQNVGMCLVAAGLVLLGMRREHPAKKIQSSGEVGAEPAAVGAEPAAVGAKPDAVSAEPAAVGAEPAAVSAKPDAVSAEPVAVSAESAAVGEKTEPRRFRDSAVCLVLLAFFSAFLNAVSGTMDKILTIQVGITSSQLQFWYMLCLLLFYGLFVIITRTPVRTKKTVKNYWIWILSVLFIAADRALFMANAYPESRVTVMTLLKQAGAVVTIIAGRFVFHEKGTFYKLLCAAVIIAGIVIGAI